MIAFLNYTYFIVIPLFYLENADFDSLRQRSPSRSLPPAHIRIALYDLFLLSSFHLR